MKYLLPIWQSPDREAPVIVYQKNWHWHHYIWACVFVHCCCSWHILVHVRAHSLTLECFKSERGCWQTAKHLVSKWSPRPPFPATVSGWNKLLLIWTGIMYSQSSEVSLYRAHVTKINIEIKADVTLGYRLRNGSRSVEVWQQQVKFAILCQVCVLTAMIAFHRLCFLSSAFSLESRTPSGVCLWLQNF